MSPSTIPSLAALLLTAAVAAGQTGTAVIDTDMGDVPADAMKPVAGQRVSGSLPGDWADDSGWAPVHGSYRRATEGGRTFLRMDVAKLRDGRLQLMHLIPKYETPAYFRLELTLRSPTAARPEVGLRMRSQPYEFLWSRTLAVPADWRDYTFDFRLTRWPQQMGLWINLGAEGTLDIARVRLVQRTKAQLVAEMAARAKAGGPKNLLRVTRLPLGLQSGWSIDRELSDGDHVHVAADPDVAGPTGSPALHIRTPEKMRLFAAPFGVPVQTEPHTASLFVRGRGRLQLAASAEGHQVRTGKPVTLDGDQWKRATVTFQPRLLSRCHALVLHCEGELWVDALQVERGRKGTDYAPAGACEVALAVDSPARVQFDDEPARVRWAVTGEARGATLRARVVTPYGDAAALKPVKLGGGFLQTGELDYAVLPARPRGPMRIEAWVTDADGDRISPPNELVLYRLRRPRYWNADAPDSPFGTHTLSTTRHILMAKAAGVNWTRLHDAGSEYIGWFHLEPAKGEWAFRDAALKRFRKHGMMILGAYSTAPKWASHFRHEKPHIGYFDRYYQPIEMDAFARYVRTVTERYKDGVIQHWDVWNEPWNHEWWAVRYDEDKGGRAGYITSEKPREDFARLQAVAYEASKAADEDAVVCGINTYAGATRGQHWTEGVVGAGGIEHCDVIAYHQYTNGPLGHPGDAVETGLNGTVKPILDKYGKLPRPVWMTEGNPNPRGLGEGFYNITLPYEPTEDVLGSSDRLVRYCVSMLANGVSKIFLYSMHTHTHFGGESWRVLVTPDGYLHPSAASLSAAAWLLEDTRFVRHVQPAEGVTCYLFQGDERAVAVLSPRPRHAPLALPDDAGVELLDVYGNPLPAGTNLGLHVAYLHAPAGKAEALAKLLSKR